MPLHQIEINGLTDQEVITARKHYGANVQDFKTNYGLITALKDVVTEPMFILLVVASAIYFITGNVSDGIFMASAIVIVSAISLYQDSRSRNAMASLKLLTQPHSKVIRNGETVEINTEEIVTGDFMVVEEGTAVPALR